MPPEEQGLQLREALRGIAQTKIFNRDDETSYYTTDGVQRLIRVVEDTVGQDEMLDLGDRFVDFLEPSRI